MRTTYFVSGFLLGFLSSFVALIASGHGFEWEIGEGRATGLVVVW
jgi:hypothetical protein